MKFGQFMSYSKRANLIKKSCKNCGLKRTQKRLPKTDLNLNIKSQSTKVNTTCSYNYLGVKVDPPLNLNEHFQSVYKTATSRLRLLRNMRKNKSKVCKLVRNCFDTIQHEKQTRNNNSMLRFPKIKLESTKKFFIFTA